ncbi:alpha-1,3-arabinosyltransferase XAT3-like [Hibiscus syriacus]|uniref:alpha-1,3-arabinosyltransferase XAT3-like n=1 Tax=Hibiscus syriacus TaxID=106335 RepID=UPI001923C48B|nr:alpha-1,3-arabinosyltransferase XAT3-like [Hibiscus syriacus]
MGEKIMYDTIFARSFSRYDQKKLGYGAFLGCFLIALSFCIVFKPDAGVKMLRITTASDSDNPRAHDTSSSMGMIANESNSFEIEMVVESETSSTKDTISRSNSKTPLVKPICHVEERTEYCETNGDIRVDGKSSTVFMTSGSSNSSWKISPYARRGDEAALIRVTKWSIKAGADAGLQCGKNHSVPGIMFSLGGYAGNNFHDYTDIVLPLILTSKQFDGEVKFLVTDNNPWWTDKFRHVLRNLSRYELIDIDKEVVVHCFTSVIVGLKRYPKELNIDPMKSSYSMKEFRQFLRSAYSLSKENAIKIRDNTNSDGKERPRLLILSRKRTRAFMNTYAIAGMARSLGYEVVVDEANSNVTRVAKTVNSCDVMMGVHGAGLTNMVFLPENAIVIQVVPIGGFEWLAKTDFGEPSKDMKLRYLDYKIKTEESTLIQQYPPDHEVFNNPYAIQDRSWYEFKSIYLEKQNVKVDVTRFKGTLLRALELLHE